MMDSHLLCLVAEERFDAAQFCSMTQDVTVERRVEIDQPEKCRVLTISSCKDVRQHFNKRCLSAVHCDYGVYSRGIRQCPSRSCWWIWESRRRHCVESICCRRWHACHAGKCSWFTVVPSAVKRTLLAPFALEEIVPSPTGGSIGSSTNRTESWQ